jgi:ABC-2 type transport system permease protein
VTTLEKEPVATQARRLPRFKPSVPLRPHVIGAVFGRNFLGYFSNPAGYVFITLFVLVSSLVAFCLPAFFANNLANLDALNQYMPYLLLFFIPAITMSIWAEERRQGTDELLLTLPARDLEVVIGKFLAALGIYTVALVFSLSHVVVLGSLGSPDLGVMFSTYLGYWLMGSFMIAVGMVASMLSTNVTVAFILGGLLCAIPVFVQLVGFIGSPAAALFSRGAHASGGVAGSQMQRFVESLSIPSQFQDFGRGVISFSGLLYFVSLTVAMLYVNMVLLGRRHWAGGEHSGAHWGHAVTRIACLFIALIGLDALASRLGWRGDMSAEGLNTLSAESKRLLREIPKDRPVYIQAYISPEVPREYIEVKSDLTNLLKEYAALGGNRILLNIVETTPFTEAARDAEKRFGITARRVQTLDQARMSSQEIYLGVAFTSGTEEVVVPFFDRGLPVEYELTRSIRVASQAARKKVGILQTDAKLLGGFDFRGGQMGQNEEWQIVTELKKQYEVSSVSADSPIASNLDCLLVAVPSSLTQKQIDNLTSYVRNGGATILLLDPMPAFDPNLSPEQPRMPPGGMFGGGPPPEPKGNLRALLDAVGIDWPQNEVVWNDYNPHLQFQVEREFVFIGKGSGAEEPFASDPATSGLQEVLAIFPGHLRKHSGTTAEFTPLLTTNRSGGVLEWSDILQRSMFGFRPNPDRPYLRSHEAYTLAARIRGEIPSEPKKDPFTPEAKKKDEPPKDVKMNPLKLIAVADADLISDMFFELRRKSNESVDLLEFDNVTFVLNCVDELAGDESFIALRKRRPKHRTLEVVEKASRAFVERAADDSKKAEDKAKSELKKAQDALNEKVEKVRQNKEMDEQTKRIAVDTLQDVENRKFEVTKARIEDEKRLAILDSRATKEQAVQSIQGRIKTLAVILPPLPALILGGIVFFVRAGRENRGATPSRLV